MYSRFSGDVTGVGARSAYSYSFSKITYDSSQFDLCLVYTPSFTLWMTMVDISQNKDSFMRKQLFRDIQENIDEVITSLNKWIEQENNTQVFVL